MFGEPKQNQGRALVDSIAITSSSYFIAGRPKAAFRFWFSLFVLCVCVCLCVYGCCWVVYDAKDNTEIRSRKWVEMAVENVRVISEIYP